ncbi:hypothetical protein SAMN03159306_02602 [Pseudomonas sp. NFACC48-1]|nr:hypothetical protein SAMN03159405_01699 [Pseudomonas sp. NFACC44-2]SDA73156.1 hypothetical protein SAMN03159429_03320 [Pseudomonas sp. NFACC51]SDX10769.1 hypothetical protein SAMN03159474_02301 [Pseudomonas sp. NFACC08-1]SEI72145.1 hypothetical protein SAMN03159298_01175 [Pseudomonas sp. NFACC07-1]SFH36408.1 hypothetical protein SAMN03159302_01314 [Pseudomonas sp. NFACC54]SFS91385.1 hypothetical protein SAMN03159306_02602 [Pseudomonas sp. NFACC48-1]
MVHNCLTPQRLECRMAELLFVLPLQSVIYQAPLGCFSPVEVYFKLED